MAPASAVQLEEKIMSLIEAQYLWISIYPREIGDYFTFLIQETDTSCQFRAGSSTPELGSFEYF